MFKSNYLEMPTFFERNVEHQLIDEYSRGFPRGFTIYDLLPVQRVDSLTKYTKDKLTIEQLINLLLTDIDRVNKQDLSNHYRIDMCAFESPDKYSLIIAALEEIKKSLIMSGADLLCIVSESTNVVYYCNWDHFNVINFYFPFIFGNQVDIMFLSFIYLKCSLFDKFTEGYLTNICPNPCGNYGFEMKMNINTGQQFINNPCENKKHTINALCRNYEVYRGMNDSFGSRIFADNYYCNCEMFYQWDEDALECLPVDNVEKSQKQLCNHSVNTTKLYRTKVEKETSSYEFDVSCECSKDYMGSDCSIFRNACVESFKKGHPSGDEACTKNGFCIANEDSPSDYTCECRRNYFDDETNDYPDCYKVLCFLMIVI
jgi:hypothetical protein